MENYSKKKYLAIIFSVIFSILFVASILFTLNKFIQKKKFTENFNLLESAPVKSSNSFPLFSSQELPNVYSFECVIEEIVDSNIKLMLQDNEFYLKLLAKCGYIDSSNRQDFAYVVLGAISEHENEYYFSYERRMFTEPITNIELWTGEQLKRRINDYLTSIYQTPTEINIGDSLLVSVGNGNIPSIDQTLNDEKSANAEKLYYRSRYHEEWNLGNFDKFIQTGESQYVPTIEGKKILPILSVNVLK